MSNGELDPKFRIRAPLRCDGVGSLDCAEDVESGVRMAIRWLPVDANGEAAAKAVEEKIPRHPVLPRIRQTGRVGSAAYVAMEFPEGRLLSTLLPDPQPADDVVRIGAAVADALAALHAQQVVHGELSADSVLMLPENKAILWDVPLVMANRLTDRRGEERELAQLIRVAPFLSPERARGLPASAPADVYALGALMSIAAGGQTPPGGTTLAVVHQIASGEWTPELPRAMSPVVSSLVKRMIARDPLSRPTAKEVAETLSALLQARPTLRDVKAVVIENPVPYAVLAPPPLPAPTRTDPEVIASAVTDPNAQVVPPPLPVLDAEPVAASDEQVPSPAPVAPVSAPPVSVPPSALPAPSADPAAPASTHAAAVAPLVVAARVDSPSLVSEERASVPTAPVGPAPIPATTLEELVAPSIVLEPELAAQAEALRATRRQRIVIACGAVAIVGIAALVIAVVALRPERASTASTEPNAAKSTATAAASDADVAGAQAAATNGVQVPAEPDVAELVAPLIGSSPARGANRPANATVSKRSASARSSEAAVEPAAARLTEASAMPAVAAPAPSPASSTEPASGPTDFSFLEQNVAAPRPGELKRPSF